MAHSIATYVQCRGGIEPSDVELAVAAQGDPNAFVQLYDRYVERITRYVAARTWGSNDVEDLVSITFMRALTKIHLFQPSRGTFAAWLFTIARNAARDHKRTSHSSAPLADADSLPGYGSGPEQLLVQREQNLSLRSAILNLTADQRDAIALRYVGELPFAEIAHILGKSEPASKMLVQRGLEALRRHITSEEAS